MKATTDWRLSVPPDLPPILEASRQAFLVKGFHGASVREIAGRVGLTLPSLYYHYQSKEGLLRAVLLASIEQVATRVEAAVAAATGPDEQLANIVESLVLSMTSDAAGAAVDATESRYLGPESHAEYVAVRDRIENHLQQILQSGAAEGLFALDDVSEARRAILGMTQAIPRWYHEGGDATPEEIAQRYVRMALRMVGVRDRS